MHVGHANIVRGVELGGAVGAGRELLHRHRRALTDQEATTPTDCAPLLSIACSSSPNGRSSGHLWACRVEPCARQGRAQEREELTFLRFAATISSKSSGSAVRWWSCGGQTRIAVGLGPEWSGVRQVMTSLESRYTIPKEVLFRDVDGEAVLLNMQTGKYFGLDDVGTRMWTLLAEHGGLEPTFRTLSDEYDVTGAQLRQDLLRLVDELVSHGLLQVDE